MGRDIVNAVGADGLRWASGGASDGRVRSGLMKCKMVWNDAKTIYFVNFMTLFWLMIKLLWCFGNWREKQMKYRAAAFGGCVVAEPVAHISTSLCVGQEWCETLEVLCRLVLQFRHEIQAFGWLVVLSEVHAVDAIGANLMDTVHCFTLGVGRAVHRGFRDVVCATWCTIL